MEVKSTHVLPDLAALHEADESFLAKHDKLMQLLNAPVHASWKKQHDTVTVKDGRGGKSKLEYIPIDKIRFLLTRIFGLYWKAEIVSYTVMFNSVAVHSRLHYCIPGTSVWLSKDGAGAVAVQLNAGAPAGQLAEIKADGVMKAFPSAFSYSLSNAAEQLGTVLGAGLNKPDYMDFAGTVYSEVAGAKPVDIVPQQTQQPYFQPGPAVIPATQPQPQWVAPAQQQQQQPPWQQPTQNPIINPNNMQL